MEDKGSQEARSMSILLNPGDVLQSRYRILYPLISKELRRTYLAKDLNHSNQHCLLKEFAPQLKGTHALEQAQELFEREAGILYRLQHPQIPQLRQLFCYEKNEGHLFLVQDYVAGETYRALLNQRLEANLKFSEAEVKQLLIDVLPILQYIHSMGVIHRDVSPDNLTLRSQDKLIFLTDFCWIKEVEIKIQSELSNASIVSSITSDSVGYTPPEQVERGTIYAHSDLYALAATAIVLLTGKEPQQLVDPNNYCWQWQSEVAISPKLEWVLSTMLSPFPSDRFASAAEVIQTLQDIAIVPTPKFTPDDSERRLPRQTPIKEMTWTSNLLTKSLSFVLFTAVLGLGGYLYLKIVNPKPPNLPYGNSVESIR